MGAVWYATVEDVKDALDAQETARSDAQIKRALGGATDQIDSALLHHFYPTVGTKYADFPNFQYAYPWRIWLNGDSEIISLTSLVSGGITIPPANYNLEPANSGPPYDRVELNIGTSSSFATGQTYQRAVAMAGVFGFSADTDPAGALAAAIVSTSATTITVTDGSRITGIGTGQLIQIDSERMIVVQRASLTTGQALLTPMAASLTALTVAVTDGTAFHIGETILLDAENMLVVDIAANNLIVKRAWNGSVLAAHTAPTIYAPRTLTVTRGVLGTTAATHLNAAPILKNRPPDLIKTLAIALAMDTQQQEGSAYGRTVGAGDSEREARGVGLKGLWRQAIATFGTLSRTEAI